MSYLLDVMCGKLAVYLRMCGHDAAYALDRGIENDDRLREAARGEGRTLITRDVGLAERTDPSILLTARDVREQLRELGESGVNLELADEPVRCGNCNGILEAIEEDETTPEYAPSPSQRRVWRCIECGQYFWRGSHWERVAEVLADVTHDRN